MGKVIAIVGAVVLLLVAIVVVAWILLPGPDKLQGLTELALIFMAATSCLGSFMFVALVGVLIWIGLMIKDNVTPLLDNAADTARTAKGTAVFVSEGLATPIIKVAGAAAGVRAAVQSLVRRKPKSGQAD